MIYDVFAFKSNSCPVSRCVKCCKFALQIAGQLLLSWVSGVHEGIEVVSSICLELGSSEFDLQIVRWRKVAAEMHLPRVSCMLLGRAMVSFICRKDRIGVFAA